MKRRDKRGLEIAFSTIVVIIISLLVLIAIFIMFTNGSGKFKEAISSFMSSSNVDDVVKGCNNLALSEYSYDFCCMNKTVKFSSKDKLEISCFGASKESWGAKIEKVNCEGVC